MDMRLSSLAQDGNAFVIHGTCPYCGDKAAFRTVTNTFEENPSDYSNRMIAAARCIACNEYILAIIKTESTQNDSRWVYDIHYPIGRPDDRVSTEIPSFIQNDFKEALRCLWVDAFNATAEMCRRAIEASCLDLGAPSHLVLEKMIDWLAEQRIITPLLRDVAHKIRLGGNRGAHPTSTIETSTSVDADSALPSAGPVEKIEGDHAEAIVEFTRQFFHHVYVVPTQLNKYDFSKRKVLKS